MAMSIPPPAKARKNEGMTRGDHFVVIAQSRHIDLMADLTKSVEAAKAANPARRAPK